MNTDTGIDAALSAFIRHPELSSIKCEGKDNTIAMEMILKGYIDEKQEQHFTLRTHQSLTLFYRLRKISGAKVKLKFSTQSEITILTLIRDNCTLSEEEINIFVLLACQEFSNVILSETDEQLFSEQIHHDVKRTLIKKFSNKWHPDQKLIAYRDRGKMFVFDK